MFKVLCYLCVLSCFLCPCDQFEPSSQVNFNIMFLKRVMLMASWPVSSRYLDVSLSWPGRDLHADHPISGLLPMTAQCRAIKGRGDTKDCVMLVVNTHMCLIYNISKGE